MLYKKEGFPEEEEFVLCTVTSVQPNSVFVSLDEYGRTGMITISEVSPGRIRNIRDFVVEGKKVVCKVLRINMERGHIDLSLRRVTESQKREKNNQIKLEQKAEKILDVVAKKLKIDLNKLYKDLTSFVFKDYENLHSYFEDIAVGNASLMDANIDKKTAKEIEETVKQRISPPEVEIKGELTLKSYASNGVDIIKNALKKTEDAGKDSLKIFYEGSGKYMLIVNSSEYKTAEKILNSSVNAAQEYIKKEKGESSFNRKD